MDETLELILKQTKNEANAYSFYYVLSYWFYENGFLKIYKWLSDSAKEELDHMDQFMKYYQFHVNFVYFPEITQKDIYSDFNDPLSIFKFLLRLEKNNTVDINNIANLAFTIGDHESYNFILPFIKEQKDGEEKLQTLINLLENNVPIYEINNHFEDYIH